MNSKNTSKPYNFARLCPLVHKAWSQGQDSIKAGVFAANIQKGIAGIGLGQSAKDQISLFVQGRQGEFGAKSADFAKKLCAACTTLIQSGFTESEALSILSAFKTPSSGGFTAVDTLVRMASDRGFQANWKQAGASL